MVTLSWLRKEGIKRVVIITISLAIVSTLVLAIIFAVLNIEFAINEGDDNDDFEYDRRQSHDR